MHYLNPELFFGPHTYAQHGEDLVLQAIFWQLGMKQPSYLDVGAYDPVRLSNTALLYERGCRGVNVDATPGVVDDFKRARPDDLNLACAVGPQRGRQPFYVIERNRGLNSLVSGMHPIFTERHQMMVQVEMIMDIVDAHCGGRFPDLLSIDIEGSELAVLETIDYARTAPNVIIAEVMPQLEGYSVAIRRLLESVGYFFVFRCVDNVIFIREKFRELMY